MVRYTLSRLLALVPVLLGVSLLAFLLANLSPGDPAELALSQGDQEPTAAEIAANHEALGLNAPMPLRYVRWLGDVARGDLGLT